MNRERNNAKVENEEALRAVVDAVRGLQFGQVQITVHDSRIVRIEKIERIRVGEPQGPPAAADRGGEPR